MSYFLTGELVVQAVELMKLHFEVLYQMGVVHRGHLHVVVFVPKDAAAGQEALGFRKATICEESFGERKDWQYPYDEIARSKAEQAWRTGRTDVATEAPELLRAGDTQYWGAAVLDGTIGVACSGVKPWWDRALATMVAAHIRALVRGAFEEWKDAHPDCNFLGSELAEEVVDMGGPIEVEDVPVAQADPNILGDPTFGTTGKGVPPPDSEA